MQPRLHQISPQRAQWARDSAKELEGLRCNLEDAWGSLIVYKVCPPATPRDCDACGNPLPRRHAPGAHDVRGAVLTWKGDATDAKGRHIDHYMHADPCPPRP